MKLIHTIFIFFFMLTTGAQDLSSHQWQERVLLVIANDTSNVIFKKQLVELRLNQEKLTERQLVIYQVKPDAYRKGLMKEVWQKGDDLYRKFNEKPSAYRVILLGLDGGEKLNQTDFLIVNDLFALIDGMPMRKAEIRKNAGNQ